MAKTIIEISDDKFAELEPYKDIYSPLIKLT